MPSYDGGGQGRRGQNEETQYKFGFGVPFTYSEGSKNRAVTTDVFEARALEGSWQGPLPTSRHSTNIRGISREKGE